MPKLTEKTPGTVAEWSVEIAPSPPVFDRPVAIPECEVTISVADHTRVIRLLAINTPILMAVKSLDDDGKLGEAEKVTGAYMELDAGEVAVLIEDLTAALQTLLGHDYNQPTTLAPQDETAGPTTFQA